MRSLAPTRTLVAVLGGALATSGLVAASLGANASTAGADLAANPFKAFDATVALEGCSGSVVRFPDAKDSDKALVLTNGHCTQPMPKPGQFVYQKNTNTKATILKGDVATKVMDISMDQLIYATMTGTDIGIYRSTVTYSQLKAKGVEPRKMATTHPQQGTQISIPSGYWKKNYTCTMDQSVFEIREGGYVFKDSFRHGCDTIHGTSGSPVIDKSTGDVIAINNTGSDNGERCTLNNPCEVDEQGKITVKKGQNYGQQTYQINACFDAGTINLDKAGCTLHGAKNPDGGNPAPTPAPTANKPKPKPTRPTPTTTPAPAPTGDAPLKIEVTSSNWNTVLAASNVRPVLLDFGATWCGACQQLKPRLEAAHREGKGSWTFASVDVDRNESLVRSFGVRAYPTVVFLWKGKEIPQTRFVGAVPQSQVKSAVEAAKRYAASHP